MKKWHLIIVVIIFASCGNANVDRLKHTTVKFEELPNEVSQYLRDPTDYKSDIQQMLIQLPKGQAYDYKLETVNTWIGPWVAYEKLINKKTGVSYKIDSDKPSPYIVFDNTLYVPSTYNILTTSKNLDSIVFTKYSLHP